MTIKWFSQTKHSLYWKIYCNQIEKVLVLQIICQDGESFPIWNPSLIQRVPLRALNVWVVVVWRLHWPPPGEHHLLHGFPCLVAGGTFLSIDGDWRSAGFWELGQLCLAVVLPLQISFRSSPTLLL